MSNELELKERFAFLILKNPNEAFKIALELFPDDTAKALKIATNWPTDLEVIALKEKIIEESGDISFLPTKADLATAIYDRMKNAKFDEDFAKLGKLYAEIRGFVEKPQTNVQINNNTDNRVMVVKDLGTDEQWENKAAEQQRKLLNVSTSKH